MAKELPRLGLRELEKYNGLNGMPTYVAYKGKVYDVSSSPLFGDGMHYEHYAGEDLTEALEDAPHGDEVLAEFPVVALVED